MGCGATAQKDAEIARLRSALSSSQQAQRTYQQALMQSNEKLSSKDAELVRFGSELKKMEGLARPYIDIERLEHFLWKSMPAAHDLVEDASKDGVIDKEVTEVLEQNLGTMEQDVVAMREIVEQHQQEMEVQCKQMKVQAQKLELEASELEKTLDISSLFMEKFIEITAFEFKVVQASKLRAWSNGVLPHNQELEAALGESSLQTVRISIQDVTENSKLKNVLVVSHRWAHSGSPDPGGEQQAAIVEHLKNHPEIESVWLDWWCLPQGERDKDEQEYFDKALEYVHVLFLGAQVLLLVDMQYLGRFWTAYEAWLSMRIVSDQGFKFRERDERITIKFLGSAEEGVMEQSLKDIWGPLSIDEAHEKLSKEDIAVTNQQDKDQQLGVLQRISNNLPALLSFLKKASNGKFSRSAVASVKDIQLTSFMAGHGMIAVVDDAAETISVRQQNGMSAVMSADPLPTDRPTCVVATFSYAGHDGYWITLGVQCQRANKAQVDFYCDYAFDTHSGYSGGNAGGTYNNVNFPGGYKPSMVNSDSATLLFDPGQNRMLLLQHRTQLAFAFKFDDTPRPLHLHIATYVVGNAITLRAPTADEVNTVFSVENVAEVNAANWPITRT